MKVLNRLNGLLDHHEYEFINTYYLYNEERNNNNDYLQHIKDELQVCHGQIK